MRKFILLSLTILCTIAVQAQSRYLWTGASPLNNNWKNSGNWTLVDGAGVYQGYPIGINTIALFGSSAFAASGPNVNCTIDGNYLPTGALYVGGIEVNDYTGTITQGINNRLVISDCPGLNGCPYNSVYKAVFNFGTGGKFIGSTTVNVAGSLNYQDNYTIGVGVEMYITGGEFYAPRKMLMENNLTITPGCFFGAGYDLSGGVVTFYPRPGSIPGITYTIDAGLSSFHDLQIYSGKPCDFNGGNVTVANNLITSGAGGYLKMNNGQLHIKRDIIINCTDYSTYSLGVAHDPGGTAMLYLDGAVQQNILKNPATATATSGPLGNLTIDNSNGVLISERVNIARSLTFVNGIISAQTPGSPNDMLVFDNVAVVSGASDLSYCEAPVRKHMYSLPAVSFEFPVGKNGEYHPAIISAPTGGTTGYGTTNPNNYTQFTVEYFDTPTPDPLSVSATTYAVHDCQYWSIERNNKPTSNAKVSLTWNSNTCQSPAYFASSADLRVAQYDGSVWQNRGVNGAVGTYAYGSKIQEATGAPVTQFLTGAPTYFTFCHATPYAPTPLTLTTTWTEPTCNPGTDGTATVNVAGAIGTITYSWSPGGQTTPTATGLAMGTYTVTVTTTGGQSGTATVNINTSTYSSVSLSSGTVYCGTSLPILLNLGTPAGGTYSGGPYVSYYGGTDYYFDPQVSGPGVFPVTYTDGFGCGYTATENIQVDPGPARPFGWEWANGPTISDVSRANDVVYHAAWDFIYVVGGFSGTVDFGGVTLTSAGGEDVYVACYLASDGSLNWAQRYGGAGDDLGTGITFTGSTIGIVGHFTGTTTFGSFSATSAGSRDGFLCSLDLTGMPMSFLSIGYAADDQVNAITNDGTYFYIVGYNNFTGSSTTISFGGSVTITDLYGQAFLAKYTLGGSCQWATNGSTDWQKSNVIDINITGNITVGGYMTWSGHGYLETYTPAGVLLKFNYFEAYPTGSYDNIGVLGGIGHDAAGNIYITGAYSDYSYGASTATFNTTALSSGSFAPITAGVTLNGVKNEIYDAVYSPDLDLINVVNIGANSGDFPHCDIEVDAAGNQYITGTFVGTISNLCYSISSFGYDDIFVMKVDNMGVFQWAQKPDGGYFEFNPSLEMDPSGNLYLCGNIAAGPVTFGAFSVNAGATNAFQAKLTPGGTSVYRVEGEANDNATTQSDELVVYPNPNNGQFNISVAEGVKDVMVYDMNGRLVFSQMQTADINIAVDISGEAKGLYLVKVVTAENVQTAKISNQ